MNRVKPAIVLLLLLAEVSFAQKLPVRSYGVAEGLSHDEVRRILTDSRGFIWFCTYDGLSRFDGERFITYGVNDGLPVASINDLIETRDGSYWAATRGGGVARFDPNAVRQAGSKVFTPYKLGGDVPPNVVESLFEDSHGNIWASTNGGVFRLSASERARGAFQRVELNIPSRSDVVTEAIGVIEDREGSIWIATVWGLARILPSGHVTHYSVQPAADDIVFALIIDERDRLWIGHRSGLFIFTPDAAVEAEIFRDKTRKLRAAQTFTTSNGLPDNQIQALLKSRDGHIWIGTAFGGLVEFDGQRFHTFAARQNIPDRISTLAEDRRGDLWAGASGKGAVKIARNGFISYGEEEGIRNPEVIQIYGGADGEVYAISSKWSINRFDGERFTSVRPNLPQHIIDSSSGRWWILNDKFGEWWVSTIEGLYRFPKVQRLEDLAHARPLAVYTKRDGLPDNNINRIYEDSRSDIWISSYDPPSLLTRWDRATGTFHVYSQADGFPSLNWTNAFADTQRDAFVGLHNSGIARFRGGHFDVFAPSAGVPAGIIQGLYRDRKGGIWVASSGGGAAWVGDPAAEKLSFQSFTTENGLSSNNLRAFVEDAWGRIYFGTAKGVDRLDASTGKFKHYTRADGLIGSEITAAFADRSGRLWFGMRDGVSALTPAVDPPSSPPSTSILGFSIDGVSQHVPELGQTSVSNIELGPRQNGVQIELLSPGFGAAGMRYQYRLDGASENWSPPSTERVVSYAHLAPGKYRFLARAITEDGVASSQPASVSFTVLPPVWRRWWFIGLVVMAVAAVIYALHRYQVRRVLEVERVRMRIATDLHDDMGLNLSRMVILSEVVKQQIGDNSQSVGHLTEIAESARGLTDSMSDIVWSIDPRRDDLDNLILRTRKFAADVFDAKGIEWTFQTADGIEHMKIPSAKRREIHLILKEALNNIARHAGCSRVSVALAISGNVLTAEVHDNGRGFSIANNEGNGLRNMQARAIAVGGRVDITSAAGQGTTVTMTIPLR